MMQNNSDIMDVKAVHVMLGEAFGVKAIRKMMNNGELPSFRIVSNKSKVVTRRKHVLRLIEAMESKPFDNGIIATMPIDYKLG